VKWPADITSIAQGGETSLQGKKIAVPSMYIGKPAEPAAKPTTVSPSVVALWQRARANLEALGATVVESDFPLITNYEDDSVTGTSNNVVGFPPGWNATERGKLIAYAWDDFLAANGDPHYPGLENVDPMKIFPPRPKGYLPDTHMEWKNQINYPGLPAMARERKEKGPQSMFEISGMAEALPALEAQRKRDLEDWMDRHGYDLVVFPAQGDVGRADVETNAESAEYALRNGVKYSNGNRAIRHMGVPTVSVAMGIMEEKGMPVDLTFAGKAGSDVELLNFAWAFEQKSKSRVPPPLTPALPTDEIAGDAERAAYAPPTLEVKDSYVKMPHRVIVTGTVASDADVKIEAYIDGRPISDSDVKVHSDGGIHIEAEFVPYQPKKPLYGGYAKDVEKPMIVLLAKCKGGAVGHLAFASAAVS